MGHTITVNTSCAAAAADAPDEISTNSRPEDESVDVRDFDSSNSMVYLNTPPPPPLQPPPRTGRAYCTSSEITLSLSPIEKKGKKVNHTGAPVGLFREKDFGKI